MTKTEVKILVESDDKLQWWAAILFAEISEFVDAQKGGHDVETIYKCIRGKVEEFPGLVIQTMLDRAKKENHAKTNQQTQDS